AGKKAVLPAGGVVDQLVRHTEMPGAHAGVDASHRIDRQHGGSTCLLQRPEVGAVVHLVRWNPVWMTMASQEQHIVAGVAAFYQWRRGSAKRRIDVHRLFKFKTRQLGKAGPADDGVNSHYNSFRKSNSGNQTRRAQRAGSSQPAGLLAVFHGSLT